MYFVMSYVNIRSFTTYLYLMIESILIFGSIFRRFFHCFKGTATPELKEIAVEWAKGSLSPQSMMIRLIPSPKLTPICSMCGIFTYIYIHLPNI